LVLWYALLATPWPGLGAGYATLYCGVANTVFGDFGRGEVRFERAEPAVRGQDVAIALAREGDERPSARAPHNSRVLGYLPAAELAALVLASPTPWRRRLRALGWGMLSLHAILAVRLWIMLLSWFASDSSWQTFDPGDATSSVLAWATEVFVVSPTPSFLIPIVLWIPFTFRRADLERL
jgi:hypothetical protein